MLIVLTSEQEITNEAALLNQLFTNGLEVLHLRKPSFTIDSYRELLRQIENKFYKRIMIHEYHELCVEFRLKGIHIQEQPRIDLGDELGTYVANHKSDGYKVSSSFHEPEVLNDCKINFDYYLLSPVFSSISKKGYEGRGFDVNEINKTIVGMGGVNKTTIPEVFKLGYGGIGILGGVWNTENPIESFKEIKRHYEEETMK
ncbi:thiamine phosphate synthase [Tenacibaculum amylolyticum]|uniref:thiamine phosphate synthase n=1 Tax=Tenacibaculum amylolyticum TaxID=104269 RepID=UPI003895C616